MKLIIEIPDHEYKYTCERTLSDRTLWDDAIRNGTPLDDVKAEIDQYLFQNEFGSEYRKEVSQILDNIGKAESKDSNDLSHMFDGVTELPKDAFKGWTTEELLEKIRAESEE